MAVQAAEPDQERALIYHRFESEEFYNLMQAYRHAPLFPQEHVIAAFEAVKKFCSDAVDDAVWDAQDDF